MNEEEKKIIKKFVERCNKFDESVEIKGVLVGEEYRILETVCKALDLVEKLQKENEELKADNYELNNRITDLLENISIQKIKDKIEEYKKLSDNFYVKFLESDRYNTDIREKGIKCDAIILALEELIEEREEK